MRIIAGDFKGRRLLSPQGKATRPITGAVKKSLFGILAAHIADAVVVDLYCGTGTLGLEALSRGASMCYFAEKSRAVLARLERNIQAVAAADRSIVWSGDIHTKLLGWLREVHGEVDLVFIDPPYRLVRGDSWPRVAGEMFAVVSGKLAADGVAVLRVPTKQDCPESIGGLSIRRRRRYGDMELLFFGWA